MYATSKFAIVAAAIAGLHLAGTSAQSISSQCQSTLVTILGSSDGSCLNAQSLVALVASSSTNSSVVTPINNWLTGLCSKPACSNSTLATIVQNVTAGCQSDLNSLGLNNIDVGELTSIVQTAYPTVRQVACLSDTKNSSTLCVTETLDNIQQYTGPLSVSSIEAIGNSFSQTGQFPNVPSNVSCTDCVHGAYSIVNKNFPGLLPSSVPAFFSQTCGSSFADGQVPPDVSQVASDAQSSETVTSNGAASAFGLGPMAGVLASSLIVVSSAFAMLA